MSAPFVLTQHLVVSEQLIPNAAIHSFPSCLDNYGLSSKTLWLSFVANTGMTASFTLELSGPFKVHNVTLVATLDHELSKHFAALILKKEGNSRLVVTASLAGAYIHVLCSVIDAQEWVHTYQGNNRIANSYNDSNIVTQFKCLLADRLEILIKDVVGAIRTEGTTNRDAYAAMAIVFHEVDHFLRGLRNGYLREQVGVDLRFVLLLLRELKLLGFIGVQICPCQLARRAPS